MDSAVLAVEAPKAQVDAGQQAIAREWEALIAQAGAEVRQAAAELVGRGAAAGADAFYQALQAHPDARTLLTSQMVNERLRRSLEGWLGQLFRREAGDVTALLAVQEQIGRIHARIRVPVHAVLHGARVLKRELALQGADGAGLPAGLASRVRQYIYVTIDLAVEAMSKAFSSDMQAAAETDGIYHAVTVSQDMPLERETQRAALLEWSQRLLFDLCRGQPSSSGQLAGSAFGMWMRHKGSLLFRGLPELAKVEALMARVDQEVLPALSPEASGLNTPALQELNAALGDIGYLVDGMFAALENMEGGRDPLTRTLNRRFLPTIVGREVAAAARTGTPFSVLMVDVDHFKAVNDRGGHAAGDKVLRSVAEVLLQCTRSSDFVFRYGGEEFVVALVETPLGRAMEVAERIRRRIAETVFDLPQSGPQHVTVSIGAAEYEGHPDYTVMLEAADRALYQAKSAGRNRCQAAAAWRV